ncbi:MAG: LPS assembly protein LptD [Spartobacteria bacterium]
MAKPVWFILSLFLAFNFAGAAINAPKDQPVEITSTGETTYEGGLATARDNVAIHIGDTDIYADYAQYNSQKHEILVQGNARIYRDVSMYVGEQAIYNTETKQIRAVNMQTEYFPYFVSGAKISSLSEQNAYLIENGTFTTHDAPTSDFHLRARTVRVYENDHVVFQNVTFFVGRVPIFWWPYVYQRLDDAFSFSISPAFLSSWGPSLLTEITFPIRENIKGRLHVDYRTRRGVAVGFDSDVEYGKDKKSWVNLKTYYLQDQNPLLNRTDVPRGLVSAGRYRVTLEDHTQFTDDIYGIIDITKLSDPFVMQDFYHNDFRIDPVPDNVVSLAKTNPFYTLTAIARFQANEFFEQTERLPEVVLDVKRHALFGGPIFYEGETGVADLHRNFASGSDFQDYGSWRFDSFHQLTYPNTYFDWLSIVPRAGFRETYYSKTRDLGQTIFEPSENPLVPAFLLPEPTLEMPILNGGDKFRDVVNLGVEASFKMSREWENAQSRTLGLDGLRHIIQPFTNFSWVSNGGPDPREILQFDRYEPSTQLRPIDFPQFTSIDSIDRWTVWRVGVRNRLLTRRDDLTVSWLDLQTYFDANIDNPYDRTPYSNLFNRLRFTPLPWASLVINSQIPVFDKGFTEVNTNVIIQPIANMQVSVGHRYLNSNPFFNNSSLFVVGGYYRFDDNWGIGLQEQYEAANGVLEQQRYSIYRDLTSWVASLGAVIRDNGGIKEYGVLLTFTLKAFPKFGFDLNFDPAGASDN